MKKLGVNEADQLRLCIALAILKNKPQDVSFQSYLLELQAAFPPSYPVPPTSDYSWKNYALKMELELKELKELTEAQEIKLAALTELNSNLNLAPEIEVASGTKDSTTIVDKVHSKTSTTSTFHASRKEKESRRSSDLSSVNRKKAKKKVSTAHGNNINTIQGGEMYIPPSQVAVTVEKEYQGVGVLKGLLEDVEGAVPRIRELGLTFALRAFMKTLASSRPGPGPRPESDKGGKPTLLPPMIQVLRVTTKVLKEILDLGHLDTRLANPNVLAMLGEVLCHTLPVTLTSMGEQKEDDDFKDRTLLRLTDIDKVFDGLIEGIFIPIIRSFRRLTETKLLDLLGEQTKSSESVTTERSARNNMEKEKETHDIDLRPELLLLFQKLVESLVSVISARTSRLDQLLHQPHNKHALSFSSLKACLVLETVRELETALFVATTPEQQSRASHNGSPTESASSGSPPPPTNQSNNGASTSRVSVPVTSTINPRAKSLIAKDTLWYLCAILHLLASLPVADGLQVNYYGTKLTIKNGPLDAMIMKDGDDMGLLDLLHETMLSALYDLVLECQTKIDYDYSNDSQPLVVADQTSIINKAILSNAEEETNPIQEVNSDGGFNNRSLEMVSVSSESQPITRNNVNSKCGSGPESTSTLNMGKESEVGDPIRQDSSIQQDGNCLTLKDGLNMGDQVPAAAGGNVPEDNDVIDPVRKLFKTDHQQPELGVSSALSIADNGRLGRRERPTRECLIDEGSFTMLLAVVERFILDPEYTTSTLT